MRSQYDWLLLLAKVVEISLMQKKICRVTQTICISWYGRPWNGGHMPHQEMVLYCHSGRWQVCNQMVCCANNLFNSDVTVPFKALVNFLIFLGKNSHENHFHVTWSWVSCNDFVAAVHHWPHWPIAKEIVSKRLAGLHAFMPLLSLPWPQADPVESAALCVGSAGGMARCYDTSWTNSLGHRQQICPKVPDWNWEVCQLEIGQDHPLPEPCSANNSRCLLEVPHLVTHSSHSRPVTGLQVICRPP